MCPVQTVTHVSGRSPAMRVCRWRELWWDSNGQASPAATFTETPRCCNSVATVWRIARQLGSLSPRRSHSGCFIGSPSRELSSLQHGTSTTRNSNDPIGEYYVY